MCSYLRWSARSWPANQTSHFRRELDVSKAEVDVFATSNLVGLMRNGNRGALCFYLKCRAGWQETTAQRFVDQNGRDRPFLLSDADRLVGEADAEDGAPRGFPECGRRQVRRTSSAIPVCFKNTSFAGDCGQSRMKSFGLWSRIR